MKCILLTDMRYEDCFAFGTQGRQNVGRSDVRLLAVSSSAVIFYFRLTARIKKLQKHKKELADNRIRLPTELLPIQAHSSPFKPFQAISSLFNLFQAFQTFSNPFKPFQAFSSFFKPFQKHSFSSPPSRRLY